MGRTVGWILIGLVVGWAGSAYGQELVVDGDDRPAAEFRSAAEREVLRAEVTHDGQRDTVAVVGISEPSPFFGIGAEFRGGFIGAVAIAGLPGVALRIGVHGAAQSGEENIGVLGLARAPDESGKVAYAVRGKADCYLDGTACTRYAVYADGDLAYTGNLLGPGDLSFQESLAPLDQALGKLLQLEVVSYEHIQTEALAHINLPEGPQVGFVAQQVAEVLPDLVTEAVHPRAGDPLDKSLEADPIRYLALKPLGLLPYLVRSIQEQQAEIEALKAELRPLRTRLARLEAGAGDDKSPVAAARSEKGIEPVTPRPAG